MGRKKNERRRREQRPTEPPVVTAQTVREQRAAGLLSRITTLPLEPPATIVTSVPPPPRASSGFVPPTSPTIDRGSPVGATPVTRGTVPVEPSSAATPHAPTVGAPTPPPASPRPPASPCAERPFDERSPGGPDLEATALRPRHYGLRLPDQSVVPVTARAVVVGRRTDQPPPPPAGAVVVALDDPGRSLSRHHVSVVIGADGGVWVTDLGSGNGTTLVSTTGEVTELEAHTPVRVRVGSLLSIGDHAATVVRRRPDAPTHGEA
nr:FHA domain-containing protein [Frigoribacterium sp. VKM Ac-1396]